MENKIEIYKVVVREWRADDWNNCRNCNPLNSEVGVFFTVEDCEKFAMTTVADADLYYEGEIFSKTTTKEELLEVTGLEDFGDIEEYISSQKYGKYNDYIDSIADFIGYDEEVCPCDCANYDYKPIEGALLVVWSWQKYIGYCRKFHELRFAHFGETEEVLLKKDETYTKQTSILLTAEEVAECGGDNELLRQKVEDEIFQAHWKWCNESAITSYGLDII